MDSRQLRALVFAVLVVASALVGGVGTVAAQDGDGEDDTSFGEDQADDAYVHENGDVTLVYRNDSDETTRADFGLSVSQSVFHALVVTDDAEGTNVTGTATGILEPDRIAANGSLAAPRPDELQTLQLDVTGEQTAENAEFDASLETTLRNTGASTLVSTAQATGEIQVTPDTFAADGQFDAALERPLGPRQSHAFSLRETADGYVLTGQQDYTVSEFQVERWNTEEKARQTIRAQYGAVAQSLGGTADVTLDSYSFQEASSQSQARLDVAFTVEYTGIDEGLQRQVTQSLQNAEDVDMTDQEARAVGEGVAALEIEEVSGEFSQDSDAVSGSFIARLSNYEPALRGAMTAVGSMETDGEASEFDLQGQVEQFEKRLDARQAAGLEETYTFDLQVDASQQGSTSVTAGAQYRTENWADYRQELADRGLEPADLVYEFHARTEGEEVTASGSIEVEKEELLKETTNRFMNMSNATLDEDEQRFLDAFKEAEFRKARFDVRVKEDTVELEAGAAFQDLTAFRDAVRASEDGFDLKIASITGRTNDGQLETYVLAKGAVGADANETEVRELEAVGDDTAVHMPGEYNRTFPEPDVERAYNYLGLTPQPTEGVGEGGDGEGIVQPGFGFGAMAAALAALVAGLLATRRRD